MLAVWRVDRLCEVTNTMLRVVQQRSLFLGQPVGWYLVHSVYCPYCRGNRLAPEVELRTRASTPMLCRRPVKGFTGVNQQIGSLCAPQHSVGKLTHFGVGAFSPQSCPRESVHDH